MMIIWGHPEFLTMFALRVNPRLLLQFCAIETAIIHVFIVSHLLVLDCFHGLLAKYFLLHELLAGLFKCTFEHFLALFACFIWPALFFVGEWTSQLDRIGKRKVSLKNSGLLHLHYIKHGGVTLDYTCRSARLASVHEHGGLGPGYLISYLHICKKHLREFSACISIAVRLVNRLLHRTASMLEQLLSCRVVALIWAILRTAFDASMARWLKCLVSNWSGRVLFVFTSIFDLFWHLHDAFVLHFTHSVHILRAKLGSDLLRGRMPIEHINQLMGLRCKRLLLIRDTSSILVGFMIVVLL